MKKVVFFALIFFLFVTGFSQEPQNFKSIRQIELEKYNKIGDQSPEFWRRYFGHKKIDFQEDNKGCRLTHIVFGWHPYWANGLEDNYQWSYLSDLAYFAYEVDYTDGSAVSTHGWETTAVVDEAKNHGVRVHLTATLFGNHDEFFGNPTAVQNLINNLVTEVSSRNADGINIDFEGMGSDNKDQFTQFIADLRQAMDNVNPDWILSICLYAVDWNGVFDIPNLVPNVDLFTIMGYDYYYSGSSTAGPTGQLYTMSSFDYNESRSVTYYKYKGVPNNKLVLGVPYYGFDWPTQSSSVPSSTTGSGSTKTIKTVKDDANGYYSNPQIEPNSLSKYYAYYNGGNRQCWVDDETTMKYKYKMVLQQGIAGIGIWALSYDDGYTEMWELIRDYFSECAYYPCRDTIWDLGGPGHAYYNRENYVYTLKPTGAETITLTFTDFDLEAGYDSLWIYDGASTSAPLIGGYSGTTSPGTITSSGPYLTLKFYSDGATVKDGFTAVCQCSPDETNPTTSITAPDWVSDDFTATYTDNDNVAIKYRFYQVADYNGSEWRSNNTFGFLNDEFDAASLNSEWTNIAGNWYLTNGYLRQDDESLSNTNLYIGLTQDTSHIYLYSWKMRLSGSGTNRRAGFHFFCEDPTQDGRLNSYMVYFRVDNNTAQIYKYIDNNYNLEVSNPCTVDENVWYDYKVIFRPKTGEIYAFQNDNLVAYWIDPDPYTSGGYVSLRTGNCIGDYDDFKVFKIRDLSTLITVGNNKEIRYQNPSPTQPAGRIQSIVVDSNWNFSSIAEKFVNVDTTAPNNPGCLNDLKDVDVTDTLLSARWCSTPEPNSYIVRYWYAVGTAPLDSNIVDWTPTTDTFATVRNVELVSGETYYFSVRAENSVGMKSYGASTDGVTFYCFENTDFTAEPLSGEAPLEVSFQPHFDHQASYVWQFGDGEFSYLQNPVHTYGEPGVYTVKVIASREFCKDSVVKENLITVEPPAEINPEKPLAVYPNPVNEKLVIYSQWEGYAEIFNENGQMLIRTKITKGENFVNLQNLEAGIYWLKLILPDRVISEKIIKN